MSGVWVCSVCLRVSVRFNFLVQACCRNGEVFTRCMVHYVLVILFKFILLLKAFTANVLKWGFALKILKHIPYLVMSPSHLSWLL